MNELSDRELLQRYANDGSQAAFAEIVRRHVNLVYSVALRQCGGDAHLAEDVAQNVFADLARKARPLSQRAVLSGWLYRSTQFAASDAVRAERRRRTREQEASMQDANTREPGETLDWERMRPVLDSALSDLDDHERDAVALRFFDGRSFGDIARTLRITEDAARKRVSRALDRLHAQLGKRGVRSTLAAIAVALEQQTTTAAPAPLAARIAGTIPALAPASFFGGVARAWVESKTSAAIAGAACVVAAGFAVVEVGNWRSAQRDFARAQQSAAAAAARSTALATEARAAETHLTATRKTLDEVVATHKRAAEAAIPANAIRMPETARNANLRRTRAAALDKYGELLPALHLDPRQTDRFLELTVRREIAQAPEFFVGIPPTVAEVDADLRRLLGAEGFDLFRTYAEGQPMRLLCRKLAGTLFYTDAPLRSEQTQSLITLYLTRARSAENPNRAWSEVITDAPTFLSPAQVTALMNLRKEQQFDDALVEARRDSIRIQP